MNNYSVVTLAILLVFAAMGATAYSYTTTPATPLIHIDTVSKGATSTELALVLSNNSVALNVLEVELWFDPSVVTIINTSIADTLCRPEFVIENTIDTTTGVWYFACGTYIPFTGAQATLATLTVASRTDAASVLSFGDKTSLYQHDGYGTLVAPQTIAAVLTSTLAYRN